MRNYYIFAILLRNNFFLEKTMEVKFRQRLGIILCTIIFLNFSSFLTNANALTEAELNSLRLCANKKSKSLEVRNSCKKKQIDLGPLISRNGDVGAQGSVGPQGEKGDTGPTGSQGIQGARGDTGSQGLKGDTGTTGSQGIQGIKGDTGLVDPSKCSVRTASGDSTDINGLTSTITSCDNAVEFEYVLNYAYTIDNQAASIKNTTSEYFLENDDYPYAVKVSTVTDANPANNHTITVKAICCPLPQS